MSEEIREIETGLDLIKVLGEFELFDSTKSADTPQNIKIEHHRGINLKSSKKTIRKSQTYSKGK